MLVGITRELTHSERLQLAKQYIDDALHLREPTYRIEKSRLQLWYVRRHYLSHSATPSRGVRSRKCLLMPLAKLTLRDAVGGIGCIRCISSMRTAGR